VLTAVNAAKKAPFAVPGIILAVLVWLALVTAAGLAEGKASRFV
jgi:hypothetical protein